MSASLFFKKHTMFFDITDHEADYLSKKSIPFRIRKESTIFMQGDPSDSIFFLERGMVRISRINIEGKKLTLDLIEPGGVFGENSLTGERERSSSADTVDESEGYKMRRFDFENYLKKRPDIALSLLKLIGDRRLSMENLLEDMLFMDVPSRIISLLIKYSEKGIVKLPLTHQEIADMCGTTRVSVSRSISRFRLDGLIETKEAKIKLLDMERLREYI